MRRALVIVAWTMLAPLALASLPVTAIRGRVMSQGKPVAGASITATSKSLLQPRTTTTTAAGVYWLEALPPGGYDVTFSAPGLQTFTRRVIVELARISRADAVLEPSPDEESITSTVMTIGVSDTTSITTHRTAEELGRFPVYPDALSVLYAAPGLPLAGRFTFDGVPDAGAAFSGAEAIDEITYTRAAQTLEAADVGAAVDVRTRSGGEELTLSLRDTLTSRDWIDFDFPEEGSGLGHLFESAGGGRLVPERLWFFASGYSGDNRERLLELDGILVKLTGQPGARHQITGAYRTDHYRTQGTDARIAALWLSHAAQWSSQWTTELVAARRSSDYSVAPFTSEDAGHSLYARGTYAFGSHVLHAGVQSEDSDSRHNLQYVFLTDRWVLSRFTLLGGIAYRDAEPPFIEGPGSSGFDRQLAATYDLRGDGRHALIATASRKGEERNELTLGYASSIGSGGLWRVDAIRREAEGRTFDSIEGDADYRLFGRLGVGGNYAWTRIDADAPVVSLPKHVFNAWLNVEVPLFETHTLSATAVQRYRNYERLESFRSTDFALRYTIPVRRVAVTAGGDVENVFNASRELSFQPRLFRFWIRASL
jgi:Carboxypeptidase regulatory-like domain